MTVNKLFIHLDKITLYFVGLIVSVMIVHICADVAGKFLFTSPVTGTITIVKDYYMPIITFLPLAFVHKRGQHISVEIFTARLPHVIQRHLYAWILGFSAVITALLAYYSGEEAFTKFRAGTFLIEQGVRVPTWPGRFCPPIGYGLFSILLTVQFLGYLLGKDLITSQSELT